MKFDSAMTMRVGIGSSAPSPLNSDAETGIDHDGELPREDQYELRRNFAAELRNGDLFAFLLDRRDDDLLAPHCGNDGILRIGDENAGLALTVTRCPFPFECRHLAPPLLRTHAGRGLAPPAAAGGPCGAICPAPREI